MGGNFADQLSITFLTISCIVILNRRRFPWGAFFTSNLSIWAMYGFLILSAVWADEPFLVVKRAVKDLFLVCLVLVIATEPNWNYALRKLFLRLGFIIFPLSVVLIKWFPTIGRVTSSGGESMYGGVAVHKNSLGEQLIVYGFILIWDLVVHLREQKLPIGDSRILRRMLLLGFCGYLLCTIGCSTAIVCLAIGVFIYWLTGRLLRTKTPKTALTICLLAAAIFYAGDATFHIRETIVESVGRNTTLTGRTTIWKVVKSEPIDILLGNGYYMFWDTQLGAAARSELGMIINTAHNGYLEIYLDGGLIGLCLLLVMLAVRGFVIFRQFGDDRFFGRMALIYFSINLIYNWSESSFFRNGSLWLMLLMAMLSIPVWNGLDGGSLAKQQLIAERD